MKTSLAVTAYAKINWGLAISGKRDDGFHEIITVVSTISLADQIILEAQETGLELVAGGAWETPAGRDNLIWRAADLFCKATGYNGVKITLDKQIPPQSGLGGGSSDCVAVLQGLRLLSGLGDMDLVREIAISLGSDTALFVRGGLCLCSGRGEVVEEMDCPQTYHLVVARPACGVSTPQAYGWLTPADYRSGEEVRALTKVLKQGGEPRQIGMLMTNSFEAPVCEHVVQVAELIEKIQQAGVIRAMMTGSGAAVIGLVSSQYEAQRVMELLHTQGYFAHAVTTTPQGWLVIS